MAGIFHKREKTQVTLNNNVIFNTTRDLAGDQAY